MLCYVSLENNKKIFPEVCCRTDSGGLVPLS